MNIIELPIIILDTIFSNIKDNRNYKNIRITCKSFYYLMAEVKRFYNNKNIKELVVFDDGQLNGYHIRWYINSNLLSMVYYINSKKENEQTYYYPSGHIRLVQYYKNGMLNGIEKHYTNYNKKLIKFCEYKDNIKINDEVYYKNEKLMYTKTYITNNSYILEYYSDYKIISATFIHNILQGKHITTFLNPNNLQNYSYDKRIKDYDCGVLKGVSLYLKNNLIEKFQIKNGKKHDWAFKWHPNNKLKSLCYFNENEYTKTLKLWSCHVVEMIEFSNNIPHGLYKSNSKYLTKHIPYINGIIDGYIVEKINCINLYYTIKFKHNCFDKIIKKETPTHKCEIFLDIDYFSYTNYINNKKRYSFKLITDYLNFVVYDNNEIPIFVISKIVNKTHYV